MRKAYLLSSNETTDRAIFCKKILEDVGFEVIVFPFIVCSDKVVSNKLSMLEIYKIISEGTDDWGYVFEDDINILKQIKVEEIIEYEKHAKKFFYLGACSNDYKISEYTEKIANQTVMVIHGNVRGLHAIGISKQGASELIHFSTHEYENYRYMDMILEKFCEINPALIVNYELESEISGHRGVFFQDRERFPSTI